MKRIHQLAMALVVAVIIPAFNADAQWTQPNAGALSTADDVFIGPGTGNGKLDVGYTLNKNTAVFRGSVYASIFNYGLNGAENIYIRGGKASSTVSINDIAGMGNVTIGNTTNTVTVPGRLSVTGDIVMGGSSIISSPTRLYLAGGNMRLDMTNSGSYGVQTFGYSATSPAAGILGGIYQFSVGGGYVKIGSVTTPNPAGYKLYVDQGILTEKVKVAVAGTAQWADYVFHKNYKLMPLEQVESFIKANKHLPGVPSAAAMVKEGNDLGKTDAKLLEKIEELTLYIIDLKKEIENVKQNQSHQNK